MLSAFTSSENWYDALQHSRLLEGVRLNLPRLGRYPSGPCNHEIDWFYWNQIGRPLIWIFQRLFLYSVADMMFSWGTLVGWYYSGHQENVSYGLL